MPGEGHVVTGGQAAERDRAQSADAGGPDVVGERRGRRGHSEDERDRHGGGAESLHSHDTPWLGFTVRPRGRHLLSAAGGSSSRLVNYSGRRRGGTSPRRRTSSRHAFSHAHAPPVGEVDSTAAPLSGRR